MSKGNNYVILYPVCLLISYYAFGSYAIFGFLLTCFYIYEPLAANCIAL